MKEAYVLQTIDPSEDSPYSYTSPSHIGALSAGDNDKELLYAIAIMMGIAFILWVKIAWLGSDPGSIDTRYKDFDTVRYRLIDREGRPSPYGM